jgi:hypothetical protein
VATTDVTVANILDLVASLMNDTAKSKYTYTAMMPYFNLALQRMQEVLEVNEIPVMEETAAAITVDVGTTAIVASSTTQPTYPTDLVEIQQLWERLAGSSDPYVPMYKRDYLPHYLDDIPVSDLVYWTWLNQEIRFIGATTDREVKLDYIKQYFANVVSSTTTVIAVMNSRTFLEFKTAAFCARYIGENPTRADSLDGEAGLSQELLTSISVKGKQDIQTRRKPFLAGYKMRSTI